MLRGNINSLNLLKVNNNPVLADARRNLSRVLDVKLKH